MSTQYIGRHRAAQPLGPTGLTVRQFMVRAWGACTGLTVMAGGFVYYALTSGPVA